MLTEVSKKPSGSYDDQDSSLEIQDSDREKRSSKGGRGKKGVTEEPERKLQSKSKKLRLDDSNILGRTVRTDIAQGTFLSPEVERVNHPDSNQESDGER